MCLCLLILIYGQDLTFDLSYVPQCFRLCFQLDSVHLSLQVQNRSGMFEKEVPLNLLIVRLTLTPVNPFSFT